MLSLADLFLPADRTNPALTAVSAAMKGSMILGIAAEVRALVAQGKPVCNLTVGDFDARQFPIPEVLREGVERAYREGATNYPPPEGVIELREAVCEWYARELGVCPHPSHVVVASGARPVMYATHRLCLERGDEQVFAVPSWNNGYYGQLCEAVQVAVPTRAEDGFFPDPAALEAPLRTARLFNLNSPLNPTGTVIEPARLRAVGELVASENERRASTGARPLLWMWDQVYWQLVFEGAHVHPSAVAPASAPWTITVDAASKAFAGTGLRVGWAVLAPALAERMKALVGHMGAWAPKPEQIALARFLRDEEAVATYRTWIREALAARLSLLDRGLAALGVEHLVPQGAMYLSVRFDWFGRPGLDGPMRTNDDIRRFLLERAGIAVVPFQAFDLEEDTGWFRMSVGATSPTDLEAALERLRGLL